MPNVDGVGSQRRAPPPRRGPVRFGFTPDGRPLPWEARLSHVREARDHVLEHTRPDDLDDTIRTIEELCRASLNAAVDVARADRLEDAVRRTSPRLVLQLGSSFAYAALRVARALPAHGSIVALETRREHASMTRAVCRHAGVADRASLLLGSMVDGWITRTPALRRGAVDLLYAEDESHLDDVRRVAYCAWMHDSSVLIAGTGPWRADSPGSPR
jgi:catechol O-methyltransferase